MKIYFAAAENRDKKLLSWCGVKNFLNSYYYLQKKEIKKNNDENIFIDSGAYSAYTQKKEIDINNYCDFLHNNKSKINIYAALDVIGNAKITFENYLYMKQKGLNPIPTFHKSSKVNDLYRLLDTSPQYMALGGLVGANKSMKKNNLWLDKVWSIILNNAPNLKVHGFGINTILIMQKFPWYSVDSTTWNVARRFGKGFLPNGYGIKKNDLIKYIRTEYNILVHQFSDDDLLIINNAISMLIIEQQINNKNKNKNFKFLTNQKNIF